MRVLRTAEPSAKAPMTPGCVTMAQPGWAPQGISALAPLWTPNVSPGDQRGCCAWSTGEGTGTAPAPCVV